MIQKVKQRFLKYLVNKLVIVNSQKDLVETSNSMPGQNCTQLLCTELFYISQLMQIWNFTEVLPYEVLAKHCVIFHKSTKFSEILLSNI
jgi:hypothetical protein